MPYDSIQSGQAIFKWMKEADDTAWFCPSIVIDKICHLE
jgi:hypothetical protein